MTKTFNAKPGTDFSGVGRAASEKRPMMHTENAGVALLRLRIDVQPQPRLSAEGMDPFASPGGQLIAFNRQRLQ